MPPPPRNSAHVPAERPVLPLPDAARSGASGTPAELPDPGLRQEGLASNDAGEFVLPGAGVVAAGTFRQGVRTVSFEGAGTVHFQSLKAAGTTPTAASRARSPVGVERSLLVDGISVRERLVVGRDASGAVLEWSAGAPTDLTLRLRVEPGRPRDASGPRIRWRTASGSALVAGEDGTGAAVALVAAPGGEWQAALDGGAAPDDSALSLRLAARLEPGRALRVALGAGSDPEAACRSAEALLDIGARAAVWAAAARRILRDRLSIRVDGSGVGASVEWAKLHLDAWALGRGAPGADAVPIALAGLAAGDGDPARTILASPDGAGSAASDYLRLFSRFLAWTGDAAFASRAWQQVRDAAKRGPEGGAEAWQAVLSELADAADTLGQRSFAAELRRRPTRLGTSAAAGPHPRSERRGLPGRSGRPGPPGRESDERWADGAAPSSATDAAKLVSAVVEDVLGAEPDAPRGRLTLRPRLPEAWERVAVERLRIGDCDVALRYERDGDLHRLRLEQTGGAVPMRVVFEPELPGTRLLEASVDGRPADLGTRPAGSRTAVPVQLVLDHERTVELTMARGD